MKGVKEKRQNYKFTVWFSCPSRFLKLVIYFTSFSGRQRRRNLLICKTHMQGLGSHFFFWLMSFIVLCRSPSCRHRPLLNSLITALLYLYILIFFLLFSYAGPGQFPPCGRQRTVYRNQLGLYSCVQQPFSHGLHSYTVS